MKGLQRRDLHRKGWPFHSRIVSVIIVVMSCKVNYGLYYFIFQAHNSSVQSTVPEDLGETAIVR